MEPLAQVLLWLVHCKGLGAAMGMSCGIASRGTMDMGSSNEYTMGTTMGHTLLRVQSATE